MKTYHKNPRKLTDRQFKLLKRDLKKLGDLSGVVHDKNSDEIISGNQRSKIFEINKCKIEITREYKKPTRTGTIAEGYIIYQDEKFSYRRVDWNSEQCERANIVANKAGGEFNFEEFADDFDTDDLIYWGFDEKELKALDFDMGEEEKEGDGEEIKSICEIVIECENEIEQEKIYNEIKGTYKCRLLTL